LRKLDKLLAEASRDTLTVSGVNNLVRAHIRARELIKTMFARPRRIASGGGA